MARPIASDHGQKRAHILKNAAQVFAREGVASASMAQVALACGISKANIYHYYPSKDALLFDILDTYLTALTSRLGALTREGSAETQLRAFARETLLAYDGMNAEHQIQSEGIAALAPAQQDALKAHQRAIVAQLSAILARCSPGMAQAEGPTLRATTMSVFGMLNWFYMWNPNADIAARRDYADLVTTLTLRGLNGIPAAPYPMTTP